MSEQVDVGVADEDDIGEVSPDLGRRPVIVAPLHSHLAIISAAIHASRPGTRVSYVMNDTAALPLALSDMVADLVGRRLLHMTISASQAFGGDLEAVNIPSGLALAFHNDAEVVVTAPGPGVVGTGSTLGFGSLGDASIADMANALGGSAAICVRFSKADGRSRHRGVSHHTRTILRLVARPVAVPVPAGEWHDEVMAGLPDLDGVEPVTVEVPDAVATLDGMGLEITSMGRPLRDDPGFAAAASAAGSWAASRCPPE
jgi:hypothetical protein